MNSSSCTGPSAFKSLEDEDDEEAEKDKEESENVEGNGERFHAVRFDWAPPAYVILSVYHIMCT